MSKWVAKVKISHCLLNEQKKGEVWRWKDRSWVRVTRRDCFFIALIGGRTLKTKAVKSVRSRAGHLESGSPNPVVKEHYVSLAFLRNPLPLFMGTVNLWQKLLIGVWVMQNSHCLFIQTSVFALQALPPRYQMFCEILVSQSLSKSNFLGFHQARINSINVNEVKAVLMSPEWRHQYSSTWAKHNCYFCSPQYPQLQQFAAEKNLQI